jgi:hypothetical protein
MDYLNYIKKKINELSMGNVVIFPKERRYRPDMWGHNCSIEGCWIETALGEECNWCGMKREEAILDNLEKT